MKNTQQNYPKSVNEAVNRLIEILSEEELETVRQSDTVDLHFGLGMFIRNELGLWAESPLTIKYVKPDGVEEPLPFPSHPDQVSSEIIEALKEKLKLTQE